MPTTGKPCGCWSGTDDFDTDSRLSAGRGSLDGWCPNKRGRVFG
jgi:hypothetical protein